MAAPSNLPSAIAVTRDCAEGYNNRIGHALPAGISDDLGAMANWFRDNHNFESLFIQKLVPWKRFLSSPNAGHFAIADFLLCGVVGVSVTANFDCLVEDAARILGERDFQSIISEQDLPTPFDHGPHLKVHGCAALNSTRRETIWCEQQLLEPITQQRLARFQNWLTTQFFGRDILVVGFWSDWAYMVNVLIQAIDAIGPRNVFLVDPSALNELRDKAPAMWDWANGANITLHHEQESGADFLEELRLRFGRAFIRHVLAQASATHAAAFGTPIAGEGVILGPINDNSLYALRRDITGATRSEPVRTKTPNQQQHLIAAIHARLLELGATYDSHLYSFRGRAIRLVLGGAQLMSVLRARYQTEPPISTMPDDVICVGAVADPTPGSVVRPASPPTILRPGLSGNWITEQALLAELI